MRLDDQADSQSVQSQGTDISLLNIESKTKTVSNVSKDTVLAITPHSNAQLKLYRVGQKKHPRV